MRLHGFIPLHSWIPDPQIPLCRLLGRTCPARICELVIVLYVVSENMARPLIECPIARRNQFLSWWTTKQKSMTTYQATIVLWGFFTFNLRRLPTFLLWDVISSIISTLGSVQLVCAGGNEALRSENIDKGRHCWWSTRCPSMTGPHGVALNFSKCWNFGMCGKQSIA
jgi:hypothetical protein